MSTWIEIRCEGRAHAETGGSDRCWSHDNEGPMQSAGEDNASVLSTMKDLRVIATESGWVRKKNGWFCPFCAGKS